MLVCDCSKYRGRFSSGLRALSTGGAGVENDCGDDASRALSTGRTQRALACSKYRGSPAASAGRGNPLCGFLCSDSIRVEVVAVNTMLALRVSKIRLLVGMYLSKHMCIIVDSCWCAYED